LEFDDGMNNGTSLGASQSGCVKDKQTSSKADGKLKICKHVKNYKITTLFRHT
jgi:hypothetical protein